MTNNICMLFACTSPNDTIIRVIIHGFPDIQVVRKFSGTIKDCPGHIIDQFGLTVEGGEEYVVNILGNYITWISEIYPDMEMFIENGDLYTLNTFGHMINIPNHKWGDSKLKGLNLVRLNESECQNSTEEKARTFLHKIRNFLDYHDDFKRISYNISHS